MQIEPGAQARVTHIVSEEDTAVAMRTGEVLVLASSRMIAWCERASFEAIAPALAADMTSVAMRVHVDHLRPAPLGSEVTSEATLERIEGRRFVFVVRSVDRADQVLAAGRITRVAVDTASFMATVDGSTD